MTGDFRFSLDGKADVMTAVTGGNDRTPPYSYRLKLFPAIPGDGFVIDAGTADIAAEQIALFVDDDSLGGAAPDINAGVYFHGATPLFAPRKPRYW